MSTVIIAPPRLTRAKLKNKAEAFLSQYHPSKTLPIPIEEIVELKLGVNISAIRGLKQEYDIDGFINSACDTIAIDEEVFTKFQPRCRYTIAHEIGHMLLHKELYCQTSFSSIEEYIAFQDNISEENNGWLEWQAHAFAAYVLMPSDLLLQEIQKKIEPYGLKLPLIASMIENFDDLPDIFGVSPIALYRRLSEEKMIEDLP